MSGRDKVDSAGGPGSGFGPQRTDEVSVGPVVRDGVAAQVRADLSVEIPIFVTGGPPSAPDASLTSGVSGAARLMAEASPSFPGAEVTPVSLSIVDGPPVPDFPLGRFGRFWNATLGRIPFLHYAPSFSLTTELDRNFKTLPSRAPGAGPQIIGGILVSPPADGEPVFYSRLESGTSANMNLSIWTLLVDAQNADYDDESLLGTGLLSRPPHVDYPELFPDVTEIEVALVPRRVGFTIRFTMFGTPGLLGHERPLFAVEGITTNYGTGDTAFAWNLVRYQGYTPPDEATIRAFLASQFKVNAQPVQNAFYRETADYHVVGRTVQSGDGSVSQSLRELSYSTAQMLPADSAYQLDNFIGNVRDERRFWSLPSPQDGSIENARVSLMIRKAGARDTLDPAVFEIRFNVVTATGATLPLNLTAHMSPSDDSLDWEVSGAAAAEYFLSDITTFLAELFPEAPSGIRVVMPGGSRNPGGSDPEGGILPGGGASSPPVAGPQGTPGAGAAPRAEGSPEQFVPPQSGGLASTRFLRARDGTEIYIRGESSADPKGEQRVSAELGVTHAAVLIDMLALENGGVRGAAYEDARSSEVFGGFPSGQNPTFTELSLNQKVDEILSRATPRGLVSDIFFDLPGDRIYFQNGAYVELGLPSHLRNKPGRPVRVSFVLPPSTASTEQLGADLYHASSYGVMGYSGANLYDSSALALIGVATGERTLDPDQFHEAWARAWRNYLGDRDYVRSYALTVAPTPLAIESGLERTAYYAGMSSADEARILPVINSGADIAAHRFSEALRARLNPNEFPGTLDILNGAQHVRVFAAARWDGSLTLNLRFEFSEGGRAPISLTAFSARDAVAGNLIWRLEGLPVGEDERLAREFISKMFDGEQTLVGDATAPATELPQPNFAVLSGSYLNAWNGATLGDWLAHPFDTSRRWFATGRAQELGLYTFIEPQLQPPLVVAEERPFDGTALLDSRFSSVITLSRDFDSIGEGIVRLALGFREERYLSEAGVRDIESVLVPHDERIFPLPSPLGNEKIKIRLEGRYGDRRSWSIVVETHQGGFHTTYRAMPVYSMDGNSVRTMRWEFESKVSTEVTVDRPSHPVYGFRHSPVDQADADRMLQIGGALFRQNEVSSTTQFLIDWKPGPSSSGSPSGAANGGGSPQSGPSFTGAGSSASSASGPGLVKVIHLKGMPDREPVPVSFFTGWNGSTSSPGIGASNFLGFGTPAVQTGALMPAMMGAAYFGASASGTSAPAALP